MKYFVPFARDEDQADRILTRTLDNLISASYEPLKDFIYQITCTVNQEVVTKTVGEHSCINDEVIMFIFKNDRGYLVCTYSRGVSWGHPIIIHYKDVVAVTHFEDAR